MIKAIAVDDEPLALDLIETFSARTSFLQLAQKFSRTGLALQYLEKNAIDLIFLDINMPAISGIDFYKSLQHKPMLIFTTSYSEFALESYELDAIDYLLKPFTYNRFLKAVEKAKQHHNLVQHAVVADEEKFIMLKADYGIVKIILSDILFIEGLDNYLKIHLHNQSSIVARLTLKAVLDKLSDAEFIRVHRSYIVAIRHVESIRQKIITIRGEEIPIGKSFEDDLKSRFSDKFQ